MRITQKDAMENLAEDLKMTRNELRLEMGINLTDEEADGILELSKAFWSAGALAQSRKRGRSH